MAANKCIEIKQKQDKNQNVHYKICMNRNLVKFLGIPIKPTLNLIRFTDVLTADLFSTISENYEER